jgi:hypothetical protein
MAFKEEGLVTPTLPAIALQRFALDGYPSLRDSWSATAVENATLSAASLRPSSNRAGSSRRRHVSCASSRTAISAVASSCEGSRRDASRGQGPATARAIGALGRLYSGAARGSLNLYGPAGTLPSVGYDEV